MRLHSLLAFAFLSCCHSDESENKANDYVAPAMEGIHWAETFDGDAMSRWIVATAEKYNGQPKIDKRRVEGIVNDVGLLMPEPAQHYGISTTFTELPAGRKGEFVLQFEARFQDGLQCGGGYVKLFDRGDSEAKDFNDATPYVIMFGPDRCGGTDKIHFILQHRNPKTGKWEEKHYKEAPSFPRDERTHLYGLVIKPDNSFDIQVDGSSKASGNLLSSMEPPVNPPKEIDDPEDAKPTDWIDEPKMADPESKKPDDWDEDEPRMIDDSSAKMPDGWLEDAEKRISDPDAKMPADWDEEEDGEWEAPTIDNPACKVGCGKWNPPKIQNPKYKGKWNPEMIDNPNYKGVWKPRQIENPEFFVDEEPSVLPKINALGIDIWTMQGGILYDNFVIHTDSNRVSQFAGETFDIRKKIEDKQNPSSSGSGMFGGILEKITENPIPVGLTVLVVLAGTIFLCCRGGGAPPPPPPQQKKPANGNSDGEKKEDTKSKDTEDEKAEEKEEKDDGKGAETKDESEDAGTETKGGVDLSS